MDIGGWLRSLGFEQYEAAFRANAVDAEALRDLTDQDLEKLGVLLGHRRKLLRAIGALDRAFEPASGVRPTPLPILPEAILAAAAAGISCKPQQGEDHYISPSHPQPSPMSSRLRPTEMVGGPILPNPQGPTLLLTVSNDRHEVDMQAAETGEAYGYHDDLPSPRWRGRIGIVVALLASAGLGSAGAFAYRAVSAEPVLPTFPPIIKAENGPNENVPISGNAQPSSSSQTSIASAGSSEQFVSRWPADNQEPPKTAPSSPNPSAAPPSGLRSGTVAEIATAAAAPPPAVAPPALTAASVPVVASAPRPPSSEPKKSHTVIKRSGGLSQTDTAAAAAQSAGAKSVAAAAPAIANQPLSLAPDAQGHAAASPPSRSRVPVDTRTGSEAGGGYAVQVASERSAADADAVFRTLQAKFRNQLGGREPIVRRTDLGPEGIYYRALIGPFASRKEAAGVCSTLKAAGDNCLVEKN